MRRTLLVVVLSVVVTVVVPSQAMAAGPYTIGLTAPTPPAGASTFTWTVGGVAPDPRGEISGIGLDGCWTAAQVASAEARDAAGQTLRTKISKGGRNPGRIDVSALSDQRLPATITVTFKSALGSAARGTSATVDAGKGNRATSETTDVGGPVCQQATYRLDVSAGTGGTVAVSPSAPSYAAGTEVTITATPNAGFELSGWTVDGAPSGAPNPLALTMNANHTVVATFTPTGPPPDLVAPPLDQSGPTSVFDATSFLYTGPGAVQVGVAPGAIDPDRVAVLRGKVLTAAGQPLAGVRITVVDHPEFGRTQSRADGMFDLAVNGGGLLTVDYTKSGVIPAQRQVVAPWEDFATLPDVVLVPYDAQVTTIDLASTEPTQVARGTAVTDASGTRQATLVFDQGTTATMTMPDGSSQPLTSLAVRATELTVGERGRQSMPADLPPASGYTYAAEFSIDAAVAAGATDVRFSKPVVSYVENFLGFDVGTDVPVGYYDRKQAAWVPSQDGRVIAIVGETAGKADVDTNGDDLADDAAALQQLGIDDAEQMRLSTLYDAGQSLWRTAVPHFSPWDYNWPYRPPSDASGPTGGPPRSGGGGKDGDCPALGSVISCLGQGLGETIDVVGTPFTLNYQSNRSPGRKDALVVPLSGDTVPSSLKRIDFEVEVAGRTFAESSAPAAGSSVDFEWDGNDAYGRSVQGAQPVSVEVSYVYDAVYATPAEWASSFGQFGATVTAVPARSEVAISSRWSGSMGTLDNRASDLGGWTLSSHQAYDPVTGTLHSGSGGQSATASVNRVIDTFAGNGQWGSDGDGGPATEATVIAGGLVAGPDGSVYLTENSQRVRKIDPDGIITTIAGTGATGFSGDGGPATQATLNFPSSLALGPDGSLYVGDVGNSRVRRIAPNGTITTFAGGGTQSGDGLPATQVGLEVPQGLAVGPDGSLYVAELFRGTIRRVTPDGLITTVAGAGERGALGDGVLARDARLQEPRSLAVAPDGTLYVGERGTSVPPRVRRIGVDGIIRTYAGGGTSLSDGIAATDASVSVHTMGAIAIGLGGLYIASWEDNRVRVVTNDGIITTVAGTGVAGLAEEGRPAAATPLSSLESVTVAPDGDVLISEATNRVRRVKSVIPSLGVGDVLIPSSNGEQLFQFNESGRHTRTLHALTGAVVYQFSYDGGGRLSGVTDADGNVTSIERAPDGKPTAIVAPGGQRTTLVVNGDGYLVRATNPANEAVALTYHPQGLLASLTEPRGGVHLYTYDALGGLARDQDPAGGIKTLARTELDDGHRVVLRTVLGQQTTYETHQTWFGSENVTTDPAGARTVNRIFTAEGRQEVVYPDGTVYETTSGPDPRFGMAAPRTATMSVRTPGGHEQNTVAQRAVVLADPGDLLSLQTLTDTTTINGRTATQTYDASTRTVTMRSPAGRESSMTFDARAHVVGKRMAPDVDPVVLTFGPTGLLTRQQTGSQLWTYEYDARRRPVARTDAEGGRTVYTYEVVSTKGPDGRVFGVRYDANGNRTGMTMPSGVEHTIAYDAVNLMSEYRAPGNAAETWDYDVDRRLAGHGLPTGRSEARAFDGGGRLASSTSPEATVAMAYGDPTDRPSTISRTPSGAPGAGAGQQVGFAYDGSLTTAIDFAGAASVGRYTYSYDDNLHLTEAQFQSGSQSFVFGVDRDVDGLITGFGPFTWGRSGPGGAISQIGDNTLAIDQGYDGLARLDDRSVKVAGTELYRSQPSFDGLGLMARNVETAGGATHTYDYLYDANQQLVEVKRDGASVETYGYDVNGNRTRRQLGAGAAEVATYDAQDRLTGRGPVAYQVNDDGFLATRGGDTFSYGSRGELVSAQVGDKTVTYSYDALGRRVGKNVSSPGGQSRVEYLYGDPGDAVRVTAVRSGADLTVLFYDEAGSLYAFERAGTMYYVASDYVGSPRVVTTASGQVVKAVTYDAFGAVTSDSDPSFVLPIGFAGGLGDQETGLVHFGYRDYEPASGRWTARDPVLFGGGQFNLYAYVGNSPVTFRDPLGLWCVGASAYEGFGGGAKVCSDPEGVTICFEVGFGVGASLDIEPWGTGGDKSAIVGELGYGFGPVWSGGGTVELDLCGEWKWPTGKFKCQVGPFDPCAQKQTTAAPTGEPGKYGFGGKLAYEQCRRF